MDGLPKDVCRSSGRDLFRAKNGVKDRNETRKVARESKRRNSYQNSTHVRFGALNGRVGDDHPKYG